MILIRPDRAAREKKNGGANCSVRTCRTDWDVSTQTQCCCWDQSLYWLEREKFWNLFYPSIHPCTHPRIHSYIHPSITHGAVWILNWQWIDLMIPGNQFNPWDAINAAFTFSICQIGRHPSWRQQRNKNRHIPTCRSTLYVVFLVASEENGTSCWNHSQLASHASTGQTFVNTGSTTTMGTGTNELYKAKKG